MHSYRTIPVFDGNLDAPQSASKKGEIVPVRISGTYDHPSFGLDQDDKKAQKVQPPHPKP
jgi:hypothetical protein